MFTQMFNKNSYTERATECRTFFIPVCVPNMLEYCYFGKYKYIINLNPYTHFLLRLSF